MKSEAIIHHFWKIFVRTNIIFLFSVPWTPYESRSTEHLKDLDNTSLSSLNKSPLLHVIHTVLTTAESFSRSLGGIVLPKLYPYQRYKVRVAARNSLGIGRFSSDIKVSEWWYTVFVSQFESIKVARKYWQYVLHWFQFRTVGDKPQGQPKSLEASSPSSSTILLMWKDPMKTDWNGKLLGYRAGWREMR